MSLVCGALLILVSFQLPWAVVVASSQQEEEEVRQFIGQLVQAWNKTDIAQIVSMFSPEAVFHTPSGHAMNRQNIERLLVQEKMEFFNHRQLVLSVTSVVMQAATHATVEGTYMLDGYAVAGFGSVPPGAIHISLSKPADYWEIEKAVMER
jgi:uncharacterized protein (TIGR02246 family)